VDKKKYQKAMVAIKVRPKQALASKIKEG